MSTDPAGRAAEAADDAAHSVPRGRKALRSELSDTLDALEYKLNVPLQVEIATDKAKKRLRTLREQNPGALLAAGGAAAAAVGTAVVLGIRAILR